MFNVKDLEVAPSPPDSESEDEGMDEQEDALPAKKTGKKSNASSTSGRSKRGREVTDSDEESLARSVPAAKRAHTSASSASKRQRQRPTKRLVKSKEFIPSDEDEDMEDAVVTAAGELVS